MGADDECLMLTFETYDVRIFLVARWNGRLTTRARECSCVVFKHVLQSQRSVADKLFFKRKIMIVHCD